MWTYFQKSEYNRDMAVIWHTVKMVVVVLGEAVVVSLDTWCVLWFVVPGTERRVGDSCQLNVNRVRQLVSQSHPKARSIFDT